MLRAAMSVLTVVGKLLLSAGAGVLLFVAWTLWGTGLYMERQQDRLERRFDALPALARGPSERASGPGERFDPAPGEPVFRLGIPAIDADHVVVEGVDAEHLRMGPGHYPACGEGFDKCLEVGEAWPGGRGRVVVSGHRTTYGAPFWDLDRLEPGDAIEVATRWGDFVYRVTELQVAEPDALALWVGDDVSELVLTTCHPRFSADRRLFVFAELDGAR